MRTIMHGCDTIIIERNLFEEQIIISQIAQTGIIFSRIEEIDHTPTMLTPLNALRKLNLVL